MDRRTLSMLAFAILGVGTACSSPGAGDAADVGVDAMDVIDARDAPRMDTSPVDAPSPTLLPIPNAPSAGARDPSLTVGPDGTFWLSLTVTTASTTTPALDALSVALASSPDGRAYSGASTVVASTDLPTGGTLEHTHSRIVFDPWSPMGSQWHLFWDRWVASTTAPPGHAWVVHRSSASPMPFLGADEKLFVGAAYDRADDADGGAPTVDLTVLSPDLASCDTPHDPGVVATADGWYVALTCDAHVAMAGRVVLLFRNRTDGGWHFLGTLATDLDSTLLGFPHFTASELCMVGSTMYLLVSPIDSSSNAWGCVSYWVQDPAHGALWREDGPPGDVLPVRGDFSRPSGSCAYEAASPTGMLYSENVGTTPDQWRLFASHAILPGHP